MPTTTDSPTLRYLAGRCTQDPQEAAFLRAMLERPDDRTSGLAYADWLEERGDPRTEHVRSRLAPRSQRAPQAEGPWERLFTLREWLDEVSRNCLRGQPVPDALTALWDAELAGESIIREPWLDETSLVADPRPFLQGWPPLTEPAARAYRALFQEIAVVAVGWGPTFIGYWLHDETTTVANAPVVFIDTEGGTMGCTAPTLQDHFLNRAWDQGPEGEASVRSWFEQRGVAFPFADPTAWDLPDLEARFNALVAEYGEGR